jgi:rubrerythrin
MIARTGSLRGRNILGGMFSPTAAYADLMKYYCMRCGTQHKQIECPKCGSKMKRIG